MIGLLGVFGKRLLRLPVLTISLITIGFVSCFTWLKKDKFSQLPENHIANFIDFDVGFFAVFTSEYSVSGNQIKVELEVTNIVIEGKKTESTGKILVFLPAYLDYEIGEILYIKGKIAAPTEFTEEFSYVEYLARKDIYCVLYRPYVKKTGEYRINPFMKAIYGVRTAMISKFERYLPEPHSSLVSGILLGVGNAMPEAFSEALRATGTTHIIAASGYNVTVLSGSVISALRFLNRRLRYLFAVGFIWIFVIISGGSIPVLRAAIMGTLTMLSMFLGRYSNVAQALALSAAAIVLIDKYALQNISFQLSFASTIGLIYFVPLLKNWLKFIPDWLEESFIVSLAAIVTTFPITVGNFGTFSAVSLLANILVIPTIEIIMILGCIFILVPSFFDLLLIVIGSILWVPVEYFIKVVELISKLPFSTIEIPNFGFYMGILWYSGLILLVYFFKPNVDEKYY